MLDIYVFDNGMLVILSDLSSLKKSQKKNYVSY